MFIILHCRVLLLLLFCVFHWYTFWDTLHFVQPSLAHPVVMLVCLHWVGSYPYSSLQSPCVADIEQRIKLINILYPIPKAASLSHLSTTIGPEHKPLLPHRVVNPWQPEFGAQCGAYGQWTGLHTYQCNAELLGDIASHLQLRQHHQLAHFGQLVANSRSHIKNDFFPQKNTCKCMTFTVKLTDQHQAVHNTITYTISAVTSCAGGLCPVTIGGHCDLPCNNPLHSQEECGELERNPTEERDVPIPSWDGLAAYRERWYQNPLELEKTTVQRT